ncbi:hypothetical protein [Actinoplanes sp. NPDC049118]|uniref:hypothetical protein n=1 Tax=Actinoplanes sp. NPDC049118 TaxID=3155769 RepID=UPI0033FCE51B
MDHTIPTPVEVGHRAGKILDGIKATEEFGRLERSSKEYSDCWATFTGYPLIANWSLAADTPPLFEEAIRVLALKTAVFELSDGDEQTAELEISAPVDEMVHAVLAQYTLCQAMTEKLGIRFIHMTDQERFSYEIDGYTDQCYRAAGWGEPNRRYWLDRTETGRRLDILGAKYESIGIQAEGRSHCFTFEKKTPVEAAAAIVAT